MNYDPPIQNKQSIPQKMQIHEFLSSFFIPLFCNVDHQLCDFAPLVLQIRLKEVEGAFLLHAHA